MNRLHRSHVLALLAALCALATGGSSPTRAAVRLDPLQNDVGSYSVYGGKRMLGSERFTLEPHGDSVVVATNVNEMIPTPNGDQQLIKKVAFVFKALDYRLLNYLSETYWLGDTLRRGIVPLDTTFTSYHETRRGGYGDTDLQPPGKYFVIEPQAFATFDVLFRALHGKLFERSLSIILISEPHDTVINVRVVPGPTERITWNGAPTTASRVTLSDGMNTFTAWLSTKGRMLRLEEPRLRLRVERNSASADSAAARLFTQPATQEPTRRLPPASRR